MNEKDKLNLLIVLKLLMNIIVIAVGCLLFQGGYTGIGLFLITICSISSISEIIDIE